MGILVFIIGLWLGIVLELNGSTPYTARNQGVFHID